MTLSVIILSYNTKQILQDCLTAVFASTGFNLDNQPKLEVIVSDNGSIDDSMAMVRHSFPQVKVISNMLNLGFSKGNNVAIQQATGDYILLLNSDTVVQPTALIKMLQRIQKDPTIGALGPKVMLANGQLDPACRRNFPNPANAFLRLFGLGKFSNYNITGPIDKEIEVEAITGACMLVPRFVINKVGMLDEEYFFYGEDLDWCFRIKQNGYKIIYYPEAEILHLKAASSRNIPFKIVKVAYTAMRIFYRKHYAPKYPAVFNWLVYLGISIRMYLVIILNIFRNKKTVH